MLEGGFPRNMKRMLCRGNNFVTDDILNLMDKYPSIDIETDGVPGEILNMGE